MLRFVNLHDESAVMTRTIFSVDNKSSLHELFSHEGSFLFKETILDASEDDQLQAAIRASLSENARSSHNDSASDEDDDEPADWFDSESDSRASESQKAEDTRQTESKPETSETRLEEPPSEDDWKRHLGPETDPVSSIVFRFPDGSKEQKALPCSSTLMV